jgi:SNF2 family DNA or RNA helicase
MMNDNSANIKDRRDRLVVSYQSLPELDRAIVQLMSVIYRPVSRTQVLACLEHTKLCGSKSLNVSTLKPYLDRLIGSGLLVANGKHSLQIQTLIAEIASRDAVREGQFTVLSQAVTTLLPLDRYSSGVSIFRNYNELVREVRLGLYNNDVKFIQKQLDDYARYQHYADAVSLGALWQQICNNPFDRDWFATLDSGLAGAIVGEILLDSIEQLFPADGAFETLQAIAPQQLQAQPRAESMYALLLEQLLLRGKVAEVKEILTRLPLDWRDRFGPFWGWHYFLSGDDKSAIFEYETALISFKKASGKRKFYFASMSGLFYILALLRRGGNADLRTALEHVKVAIQAQSWLSSTYKILEQTIEYQTGKLDRRDMILTATPFANQHSIEIIIRALCMHWIDKKPPSQLLPDLLENFFDRSSAAGYHWLAMEAAGILSRLDPSKKFQSYYQKQSVALQKQIGITNLATLIQPQEQWELCLTALTNLHQKNAPVTADPIAKDRRLAWAITMYGNTSYLIQPREQSRNAKGEWSKGRNVALKRLRGSIELDYLTPQDLKICGHIESYNIGGWGSADYRFNEKAIGALIGHPLVFWEDNPISKIEVVAGEPELTIETIKDKRIVLAMSPELAIGKNVMLQKESPTRLKAIFINEEHRRIAEILGKQNRLEVPMAAKDRVLAAISSISNIVNVHSDIGGGAANIEEVPSDPQPHVQLFPHGSGLKVAVLSRPFAPAGPYYSPGVGGKTIIAEVDGQRLQTTRDLVAEKRLANAIISACPTLERTEEHKGEWLIEEAEDCLELLVELQALEDVALVEWPEGEKMRVSRQAGLADFQLRIQRENDWFATTGSVQVDEDRVVELQQLLTLLDRSPSRFVPLGDGQFLALTEEFRQRLNELRGVSERHGKGFRIHPLAALTMEDWLDDVEQLKTDKHWQAHIKKLREVESFQPELPSTLQAELRDYQVEGFRWLARLSHWGVGACLADDMGLGKTVQSLALILTRAAAGATLIIAPTSVCMNWMSEAERFAPTLNPIQFGTGDRQAILDNLQPFDLVVCSYGLLQQEDVGEMLAKIQWQTIVLDEAQSIKNFATKRSQAAMNLQGGFKLIVTGTPIENHLGELWNLFRFINPGLLGSLESFNERFGYAIENASEDRNPRNHLRKLIQPFILRRLKHQVLTELPSRTEITLQVELSAEEMAFYEALRQQAIVKLADSDAPAGQKHLQVLAEIMKLRQACCNPKLISPDIGVPSAKLQLFGEVLTELLENKHKALVFSQFVGHLSLIRQYLDSQKIAYQYLDGSTSARDRKLRVDAFQAGAGDVFLISLKAGGTGLNLTAADYVIHMDPWWNPAVEDQASDRTHRIGQKRPVTIYRLVAKHTIEEKIVDLHKHKRDLADSLLEGADVSAKVSTAELLKLINAQSE